MTSSSPKTLIIVYMLKTPDSVTSPDLSSEGQTRLFICRAHWTWLLDVFMVESVWLGSASASVSLTLLFSSALSTCCGPWCSLRKLRAVPGLSPHSTHAPVIMFCLFYFPKPRNPSFPPCLTSPGCLLISQLSSLSAVLWFLSIFCW